MQDVNTKWKRKKNFFFTSGFITPVIPLSRWPFPGLTPLLIAPCATPSPSSSVNGKLPVGKAAMTSPLASRMMAIFHNYAASWTWRTFVAASLIQTAPTCLSIGAVLLILLLLLVLSVMMAGIVTHCSFPAVSASPGGGLALSRESNQSLNIKSLQTWEYQRLDSRLYEWCYSWVNTQLWAHIYTHSNSLIILYAL